jgi:hypothetical protein
MLNEDANFGTVFCFSLPFGWILLMPCAVMAIPNLYILFSFSTVSALVSPWLWMIVIVEGVVTLRHTSKCALILFFSFLCLQMIKSSMW